MKTSVSRPLTRLVVTGVGLVAALAFASPASAAAAGADLAVSFTGATIAANAEGKFGSITLTNHGPETPTDVVLSFDLSGVDDTKVEVITPDGCAVAGDVVSCELPDGAVPPEGGNTDLIIPLLRKAAGTGDAGTLAVSVSSAVADPDTTNNTATAALTLGEPGADLLVIADDVYALDEDGVPTTDPIPPGESSALFGVVVNQGDLSAIGIKVVVNLPEHVTFAETEPDCTYTPDNRVATCEYDVTLTPLTVDPEHTGVGVFWPVTVSEDAPGPVALEGGLLTAEALDVEKPEVPGTVELPSNARWAASDEVRALDVDPTDNSDEFTVFVAGPPGNADLPQTGDDLPETGDSIGLYTGIGAAVLVVGAVLVLLTRRRRAATVSAKTL